MNLNIAAVILMLNFIETTKKINCKMSGFALLMVAAQIQAPSYNFNGLYAVIIYLCKL